MEALAAARREGKRESFVREMLRVKVWAAEAIATRKGSVRREEKRDRRL